MEKRTWPLFKLSGLIRLTIARLTTVFVHQQQRGRGRLTDEANMEWVRRVCMAVGLSVAITAVAAAQQTVTYAVTGVETGFTDTSSSFVGVAASDDGDFAWWQADVERDPLDQVTLINGGTFQLDGQLRDVTGTFTDGVIVRLTSACRREIFAVTGNLELDGGGSGTFNGTLTHYGFRVGTQCITYFATVQGLVAFILP